MPATQQANLRLIATILACLVLALAGQARQDSTTTHVRAIPPVDRGTLIICHPPQLAQSAAAWATHRAGQGWQTTTIAFDAGRHERSEQASAALDERLKLRVKAISELDDTRPIAILLLGDAGQHEEPTAGLLPTFRFNQPDPSLIDHDDEQYASDHPYQVIAGSDRTKVMLGRIPVRTNEQARTMLRKIIAYEQQIASQPWPMHVEYVAGEGHFGALDRLLETLFFTMVNTLVPERCTIHVSYAKPDSIYCPPPEQLTETILRQLATPSMLFNYVGHGNERGFDSLRWRARRYRMLTVDDLADLPGDVPATPLALLTCCSSGWFDLPDDTHSLAEAMLLHPAGPPAVLAGSRPTHPYANAVVQHALTDALLSGRMKTLGELDLHALQPTRRTQQNRQLDLIAGPIAIGMQWPVTLSQLRDMHTQLYNLLGDPTMQLPRPPGRFKTLTLRDGRLVGETNTLITGEVTVTIESDRTRPARRGEIATVTGRDDPDLPAKAQHNHALANERTLRTLNAMLTDGRFSIALDPATLPANAALIRVTVRPTGPADARNRPVAITDTVPITLRTRLGG